MTVKTQLAQAYQILGHLKLDDHTYTHLSARAETGDSYYVYPFGLRFEEVRENTLMHVSFGGTVLEGQEHQYNKTGYTIHGAVYQARPDVRAVFHLHTPAMVAVSAIEEGLLPISQWALHFYDQVAYHAYDSLALDGEQGQHMAQSLGTKNVMLLRHHGGLFCGKTMQEALFYAYHMEKACQTQCLALGMGRPIIPIAPDVCEKSVKDLLTFEKNLGERDWNAWVRFLGI